MQDLSNFKILFALLISLSFCACGKVGAPQPPFIRIPEAVKDLAVTQTGHDLTLSWTDPPHYIDGSTATNLSRVQVRSGDVMIGRVDAAGPGQAQSYTVPVPADVGTARSFSVVIETSQGKLSAVSNIASITPVEVPGGVTGLASTVDQREILLRWNAPREHPELADAYIVTRSDVPAEPQTVMATMYEDHRYLAGAAFTYQVTPARRVANSLVMGDASEPFRVMVVDKIPPRVPTGIEVRESGAGGFITWDANEESDLAGYRIFRSDRPDGGFKQLTDRLIARNTFVDLAYQPAYYYALMAVDDTGNESAMSPPFRAQ
jgi:fibronectin type 3 domain-containing protein